MDMIVVHKIEACPHLAHEKGLYSALDKCRQKKKSALVTGYHSEMWNHHTLIAMDTPTQNAIGVALFSQDWQSKS